MAKPLRVGAVNYLNTKPLIEGLPELLPGSLLHLDLPSRLADSMRAGEVDIGLIPVAEYFRAVDYGMIPGLGIVSHGPVRSVILCSRCPASEIRTLAMDEGSRTSAALVRILLEKKHHIRPQLIDFPIHAKEVPANADAVLLIGDRAMGVIPQGFCPIWDLGEIWHQETGLPFVYAVWATLPGVPIHQELVFAFHQAREFGRQRLHAIASREAALLGFSQEVVANYLGKVIHYEVGEAEAVSMALFRSFLSVLDYGLYEKKVETCVGSL